MAPRRLDPHDIASAPPPGGGTLVAGCSGESLLLAEAVMHAGDALGAMTFTDIFVPRLNTGAYLSNPECRVETFFLTPELKAAGSAVKFIPLCYVDILARLRSVALDAALFMTTTPDAHGSCGFGPALDFLAELWPRIPVRIAHINPRLPRVESPCRIPFSALTAYVEADQELLGFATGVDDWLSQAIGESVAKFVGVGSTIQMGLGKITTAVLRALSGRRNQKIHSGLIPEAVIELEDAGALAPGISVTGGVAIGSARLYDRVGSAAHCFHLVSYTHAPRVVAGLEKPVSLNSALEVDLYGRAYAELGPDGLMSGPGGASGFARGVWAGGGLRILALAASAADGAISRVIAPGATSGPVSLGRMDTDIVVTEYGAADLRGLDHHERARALIAVAAPACRDRLSESWAAAAEKF